MSVDLSNKYAHTEGRFWWAAEKGYRNIISAEGHAGSGAGFPLTFATVSRACILGN
jgi:hypothetical protein